MAMAENTAAVGQICVAPLSSPYSLLLRAHTYALVAALIVPLPRGWLFRAALAAFTTRTAIFAIDAAVILHTVSDMTTSTSDPVPVDAVVVLELLGLAVIVACWLLVASSRVSESSARPLIRIWAAAVTIGSILAFVSVAKLGKWATVSAANTESENVHCEGVWRDEQDVFGATGYVSGLGLMGRKFASLVLRVGIPPLVFSVVALFGISVSNKQRMMARRSEVEQGPDEIILDTSGTLRSRLHSVQRALRILLSLALPAMAIFMVVSAETYLLAQSSNIPSEEKMSSVGQWGVWAATGAVLVATLINAVREKMGVQKVEVKWAEDESPSVIP
ncbi:hypothetical protein GE09DRAFT_1068766 [Coniochaeta sp. 2T2.1]|nr:hypothetical protein GE09DRAFT_1068766 [Coniochaeta sp. 2T2.1]